MGNPALQDVEDAFASFPGLGGATVVEQADAQRGALLVAYVAAGTGDVDVSALHAHLRGSLPGHRVPAAVVVVDAVPRKEHGDVDGRTLPVPDLDGFAPYRGPDGARQETLCEVFADVLGVPRVGVDDDFLLLGGQSLEAMMLAGRVTDLVGSEVTMVDLFEAPTVAALDKLLEVAQ